jgi:hypothetical protein
MEVTGQPDAPAAHYKGKSDRHPLDRRLVGPKRRINYFSCIVYISVTFS